MHGRLISRQQNNIYDLKRFTLHSLSRPTFENQESRIEKQTINLEIMYGLHFLKGKVKSQKGEQYYKLK